MTPTPWAAGHGTLSVREFTTLIREAGIDMVDV